MTRRVALVSLSIAAAFSCAAVAVAEASSSTTRIDDAVCHPEKGGGNIGSRSCAGLGGWAVHTARNGDKSGVIFGLDGGLQPLQSLAAPGWAPKVLWRFDGREPVAAAHRVHTADGTVTIVTRLAEPKACHSAYIDADLRESEAKVEQALDRAETFRCGIDQPVQIGRAIYAVAVPSATLLAAPSIATAKSLPTVSNFSERPSDPPTKLLLPLRAGAYAPIQRGCARIDGNYADYDSILNFYGDDFSSSSVGYRIESTVSQGSAYTLRIHVEPTGGIGYVGNAKHIVWNVTLKDSTHFEIKDHDRDGDRTGQYVWCAKNTTVMMEENFHPQPEAKPVTPNDFSKAIINESLKSDPSVLTATAAQANSLPIKPGVYDPANISCESVKFTAPREQIVYDGKNLYSPTRARALTKIVKTDDVYIVTMNATGNGNQGDDIPGVDMTWRITSPDATHFTAKMDKYELNGAIVDFKLCEPLAKDVPVYKSLDEGKIHVRQKTVHIDRSEIFDKPLAEVVVPTAPPDYDPQNFAYVACFFYPEFVVKELDLGEKGSEKLSIAPNPSTRHCSTKHLPGETVVKNELGSKWSGYFKGVKGSFAFFESSDSMNGAFGFSVVDTTIGATMFADDASFKEGFSKVEIADSNLKIEYQRSLSLGCSLMTDPNSCWQKIASATGLAGARRPDCAPSYARFYPAEAEVNAAGGRPEQIQAIDKVPSVITYNARARVGKKLESLAPLPGLVSCAVAE